MGAGAGVFQRSEAEPFEEGSGKPIMTQNRGYPVKTGTVLCAANSN